MSATTRLEFTLTSPGQNNNPSGGGGTSTITPSGTTTIVSYPNTGENNPGGDSSSGSVFMALFAVIGLAALAVFLVRYLKKNRRISFAEKGSFHLSARPRVFATAGLVLAVALLGSFVISKINSGRFADAATVELEVTAAKEKKFNVSRGQGAILGDTIKVANNGAEYTLYVSASNNKFCLDGKSTPCLDPTTGSISSKEISNLSSVQENQWGISLLDQNDLSAKAWAGAPTSSVNIYTGTASETTVRYAVNLGTNLSDGTYYTDVTYRAFSKADPEVEYTVITHNGFVGKEGTSTTENFKDGAQVWIRHNCGEKKFLYWTINNGNITDQDLKADTGIFSYFIMPESDVELTAHCEGDTPTPSSKWVIKYDKNISTATGTMNQTDVTTESVNLSANTFTLNNSTFKGWSCTAGKPFKEDLKNFDDKASVTEASLKAAGCNPTTTDNTNTYTVYALWKPNDPKYIQDVTAEYCDSLDFFDVKSLKDARNEDQSYRFAKYADGRCWMLDDLAYAPGTGNIELKAKTTDIESDKTVTFGTNGARYKTQTGYSTLYNFKAATAGAYSNQSANTTIGDSLCPTSWKLPDAQNDNGIFSDSQGELYGLHHYNIGEAYGKGAHFASTTPQQVSWERKTFLFATNKIELQTASNPILQPASGTANALNFKYSGAWDFSGSGAYATLPGGTQGTAGTYASYFMSTVRGSGKVAAMNPHNADNSGDTDLQNGETDPDHGSSVRCVLRTAKQRTSGNRNAHVHETDITGGYNDADAEAIAAYADKIATYNQTH